MLLKDLITHLNELFFVPGLTDFAPNGLQIEGKQEILKVATAVTANLETIEEAIEKGVDALIVHHGLFWQRESYVISGIKKEKIFKLLKQGISLFAYHLPLDFHREIGNNWKAAMDMGWQNLQPFGFCNGIPIGVRGFISPCSKERFKEQLEKYYEHSAIEALGGEGDISQVALISGGSHKSIQEASEAGVYAFVTGSFDEPIWYQAKEEKINFFALGHSATERIGPKALAVYLTNKLNLPCEFIDVYNPF